MLVSQVKKHAGLIILIYGLEKYGCLLNCTLYLVVLSKQTFLTAEVYYRPSTVLVTPGTKWTSEHTGQTHGQPIKNTNGKVVWITIAEKLFSFCFVQNEVIWKLKTVKWVKYSWKKRLTVLLSSLLLKQISQLSLSSTSTLISTIVLWTVWLWHCTEKVVINWPVSMIGDYR